MNKRARFDEKRDFVIHWMLEFHVATRSILCGALGINSKNQNSFFLSLKKSGLFEIVRHPLLKEQLWMLNFQGKQYAARLSEKAERYHATPSRVVNSTTVHTLSVQRAIIDIKGAGIALPFDFQSERMITTIEQQKRPDALVTDDQDVLALEVELTQKSRSRIYLGFMDHIENMKAQLYERVLYVFPTQALCDGYKRRFDQPQWPVHFRNKYGKIRAQMDGDSQVMAKADSEAIRSRFRFDYLEALNQ